MTNIEELLKARGKVSAPEDFTSSILLRIEKIMKAKEFIEYLISSWIKLVIFLLITIENFFTKKIKSDV